MLDWIFDAIVSWVGRTVTQLLDAVSGLFLNALGTDMTAMEEYFPFITQAFTVLQYTAWTLLFIITIWQLFRAFGGPITEAENPLTLLAGSAVFALLIGFAKPIFLFVLSIARAPYTALMEIASGNFTFAGIESALKNGLLTIVSLSTIVGALLLIILMVSLGWNYFKLLLEVVERYIVVGVLCYTSPLAYSMGASKSTSQIFKSWCRMVGSQLLLLVMNVWFLRAFNSSVGQYIANGGTLTNGQGSIFLWLFCALAFLKMAQRFDSYLSSLGLNAAQTGSGLGMEIMMAAKSFSGAGKGMKSAGSMFGGLGTNGSGGMATGFAGIANRFKGNSYVRDAVVQGGTRMGAGGPLGFIARAFGGIAAKNGATLNSNAISSVASRPPSVSGSIGGEIANKSLGNYMPHLKDRNLSCTRITGGQISTKSVGADGQETSVELFSAAQFDKPTVSHSLVTAADGSQWYQMAEGAEAGSYFDVPVFNGSMEENTQVAETFPNAKEGTTLRTVGDGILEASTTEGNSCWYSSAHYDEPDAPHTVTQTSDGVDWYAMQPNAALPNFEAGDSANEYNKAQFRDFMPGYEGQVHTIDNSHTADGVLEIRHADGSGTKFYDSSQYTTPRGDYQTFEDKDGNQWYALHGEAVVDHKPVYENANPVYEDEKLLTITVPSVRYGAEPSRFSKPKCKNLKVKAPRQKR